MSGLLIRQGVAVAVATRGVAFTPIRPRPGPFVDGIVVLVTEYKWLSSVFV